jgi:hypothetical protein
MLLSTTRVSLSTFVTRNSDFRSRTVAAAGMVLENICVFFGENTISVVASKKNHVNSALQMQRQW